MQKHFLNSLEREDSAKYKLKKKKEKNDQNDTCKWPYSFFSEQKLQARQKSKFYTLHIVLYTSQIVPIALLQLCLQHIHRQGVLNWSILKDNSNLTLL